MSQLPVLAIRPEPGLSATLEAGRAAGLRIAGFPLFEVMPVCWEPPDPATLGALLVGSANVFRHGGEALKTFRELPVLAVGETTAWAARDAGFFVEAVGTGGLQSLIDKHGTAAAHWLRLAGEEHVPLDLPTHLKLTTRVIYRVEPVDISSERRVLLESNVVVLLHSAAAGRHFAQCCEKQGIDRSRITLAALGPRILSDVGEGWKSVHSAASPSEGALLALAKRLSMSI
ncbi:uroporphyrinogen-III synthase [Altererythrobacter sp. GH1-8]|uniref:uroporphyrinogen-III synthase n=1 Tax=Altererythrobacter sp. GH1-8 TaxID=3349333 RepID=UPI00374DBFAF